jgi:hypothetical protein
VTWRNRIAIPNNQSQLIGVNDALRRQGTKRAGLGHQRAALWLFVIYGIYILLHLQSWMT